MKLNERIDRALARSKDPDPHNIARKLMARMEQTERDAALSECLADRVRIQITRARLSDQVDLDAQLTNAAGPRTEGPSKWKAMIQPRVYVPEVGWKFELDLTAADLHAVADEYVARASMMTAKERKYRALAVALERTGAATVGEWRKLQEQAA